MEELSLHILDIMENSLRAGAGLIQVEIIEDLQGDRLTLKVKDDGKGMNPEETTKALDPFYSTRTTRRVGLGLSLLQANARACEGDLSLESSPDRGTTVKAWFRLSHIDRQPLGKWPGTFTGFIFSHTDLRLCYKHQVDDQSFEMDTHELENQLGSGALNEPQVISGLKSQLVKIIANMGSVA